MKMSYQITVDWCPAYELVVSLGAYFGKSAKTLELGLDWAQRVKEQGGEALAALEPPQYTYWLDVAIWRSPGSRDVPGFLGWLGDCPIGHLYTLFAPYAVEDLCPLPPDLEAVRAAWVRALTTWNERYFRHLDPAILDGLAAEAAARREEAARLAPEEVVERATGGIQFIAPPEITRVLLIPQYHYRPLNMYWSMRGWRTFLYPTDALPLAPDMPPPALQRLTRALDDENRLRILRLLSSSQRSFTEIVQEIGLAKSTVHHHMVTLRAAGLVRLQDTGAGPESYTLRSSALPELNRLLSAYFTAS